MINIVRRFICDKCGKSVGQHLNITKLTDEQLPNYIPEGWRQIGDTLICPDHKVEAVVSIDGEITHTDNKNSTEAEDRAFLRKVFARTAE